MTKEDLLKLLTDECQSRIRRSGDITLRDFRKAFFEATKLPIGDKKAARLLMNKVEAGELVSMIVFDSTGHDVRIWRKVERKKKAGK